MNENKSELQNFELNCLRFSISTYKYLFRTVSHISFLYNRFFAVILCLILVTFSPLKIQPTNNVIIVAVAYYFKSDKKFTNYSAPDLGSSLGTKTAGNSAVGKAGDLSFSFLDDGHGEDGQVTVDDAAADGLALLLSGAALAVTGVSLAQ
jgi:hypothetical protein